MLHYWHNEVVALVRQVAGGAEHLNNTDHTEEKEHHPNDLVALENITYPFVHFTDFSLNV